MIGPGALFAAANAAALLGWIALVAALFAPRLRGALVAGAGYALPCAFAALYVGAAAAGFAAAEDGGFGSLGQVRALFANDHGLLAGWLHYLAFDLIVGAWIVRSAAADRVAPAIVAPCLMLTFLFGPAGFLCFLIVRAATDRRDRRAPA